MRVQVSRLKTLDELYVMRDKAELAYQAAVTKYEKDMKAYQKNVMASIETAAIDIAKYGVMAQEHDEWDNGENIHCWDWYNQGIRIEVVGQRPRKPDPVNYRLRQTIEMLERCTQEKISIDENHIITKLLVDKPAK